MFNVQHSSMYSLHRSQRLYQRPPFQVLTRAHPSWAAIRSIQIRTAQSAKSAYVTSCPIATTPSPSPQFLSMIMARKSNCSLTACHAISRWGPAKTPGGGPCPPTKCICVRSVNCWWLRGTIMGRRGFENTSWIKWTKRVCNALVPSGNTGRAG